MRSLNKGKIIARVRNEYFRQKCGAYTKERNKAMSLELIDSIFNGIVYEQ